MWPFVTKPEGGKSQNFSPDLSNSWGLCSFYFMLLLPWPFVLPFDYLSNILFFLPCLQIFSFSILKPIILLHEIIHPSYLESPNLLVTDIY